MTAYARRAFLGMAPGLALTGRTRMQTEAAAYPQRSVRYIVPFTPAGITDIMARLVAQKLSEKWKRAVAVQNIPGVQALIGATAAFNEPADGYTLLAITSTHAANASLFPNLPYDLKVIAHPL